MSATPERSPERSLHDANFVEPEVAPPEVAPAEVVEPEVIEAATVEPLVVPDMPVGSAAAGPVAPFAPLAPPTPQWPQPPQWPPHQQPPHQQPPPGPPSPGSLASFFLDGERRLRTAWRFILFFFAIVAVELGAAIATLIALVIYFGVSNAVSGSNASAERFQQFLGQSPLLMAGVGGMVSAPLSLGLCWVFRRFLDRRSLAHSGFVWPRSLAWGGSVGTLAGVLLISLSAVGVHLLGGSEWQGMGSLQLPLLLFFPLIGAAFHEEVLVRGYLLQNLVEIKRPWFGIFFSSLIFWLVHGLNPNAWSSPWVGVNLFLAGILLALAYLRSGNILYPTAMHFGWNYAQGPLLGIPVSGMTINGLGNLHPTPDAPTWLTGGEFGLEASAVTSIVQVLAISALLLVRVDRSNAEVSAPNAAVPFESATTPGQAS